MTALFSLLLSYIISSATRGKDIQYTISGFSSGGTFATQYGVAYSSEVTGVGIIAGYSYDCEADSNCLTNPGNVNVSLLISNTKNFSNYGYIDDWKNILNQRIYTFSGTKDTLVPTAGVQIATNYYKQIGVDNNAIYFNTEIESEHGMVTTYCCESCSKFGYPWIVNCDYNLAGEILKFIYSPLKLNEPDWAPTDRLFSFNQKPFIINDQTPKSISMSNNAYIYIPINCTIHPLSNNCKLHVVYHGCGQGNEYLGDSYAINTGYNGWADTNNLVIFYPQCTTNDALGNADGCWDFYAYTGYDYVFKTGAQPKTVNNMVQYILNSNVSDCNYTHIVTKNGNIHS